jgi:hypothetical protein
LSSGSRPVPGTRRAAAAGRHRARIGIGQRYLLVRCGEHPGVEVGKAPHLLPELRDLRPQPGDLGRERRGTAAAGRKDGGMKGVESRLGGSMLIVRIPMRFQHRGGRKRIVAPDGSEIVPTSKPQPDGTLVKALARAWRWQKLLDEGVYASVSEIGDAENISKSYVSRILRLALLAPDIIEAILTGRTEQEMMLEQLERPLPASWEEQRTVLIDSAR